MPPPEELFTIHHDVLRNQTVMAPDDSGAMFHFDGNGDARGVDRVNAGLWLAMPRFSTPQGRARLVLMAAAKLFGLAVTAFEKATDAFKAAVETAAKDGESLTSIDEIVRANVKADAPSVSRLLPNIFKDLDSQPEPQPAAIVKADGAPAAAKAEPEGADDDQELTLADLEKADAERAAAVARDGEAVAAEHDLKLWGEILGKPWRAQVALAQETGRPDITTKAVALEFLATHPANKVREAMARLAVPAIAAADGAVA